MVYAVNLNTRTTRKREPMQHQLDLAKPVKRVAAAIKTFDRGTAIPTADLRCQIGILRLLLERSPDHPEGIADAAMRKAMKARLQWNEELLASRNKADGRTLNHDALVKGSEALRQKFQRTN